MRPPPLLPPYAGAAALLVLIGAAIFLGTKLWRARLVGAWRQMATRLSGTLDMSGGVMSAKGTFLGHAAFLRQAVSHEDPIPYPHTRGSLNVRNPANVVLGLRHKSLLEEVATRKDARPVETGDADFDRVFFLVLNAPEHAAAILPDSVRRVLLRYSDVEVYVRSSQIEWRRSGTLRSVEVMTSLFNCIADMADALAALPVRQISLTQKLEDEALIEKGV